MINIRTGCFETNSSSCHSIVIPKHDTHNYDGRSIHFGLDSYGWEIEEYWDSATYLYSAIVDSFEAKDTENFLEKLKDILDKHNIHYTFEPIKLENRGEWGDQYVACNKSIWSYGVDHGGELRPMIETLLNDENLLMRYLFGDTVIYTGNDNGCDQDDMCYCADEIVRPESTGYRPVPNPNHQSSKYDYFFKGN